MICRKPFHLSGALSVGCGQCMPCRINKKRLWKHRLILESYSHKHSAFVTLTYEKDPGTLVPKHYQDWLKRLRKAIYPAKVRYAVVGEYGDEKMRPHYHAILFGVSPCFFYPGESRQDVWLRQKCKCPACSLIRNTWCAGDHGGGLTDCGSFSQNSANYVCGYVTKKMTSDKTDFQRDYLKGRHPEFFRPSKKPGLGAHAAVRVAMALGGELIDDDVPMSLRHGKKLMPLGRYLRSQIRKEYGLSEIGVPKEVLKKVQKEMLLVQEARIEKEVSQGKTIVQAYRTILDEKIQKCLNAESRYKIKPKKGNI